MEDVLIIILFQKGLKIIFFTAVYFALIASVNCYGEEQIDKDDIIGIWKPAEYDTVVWFVENGVPWHIDDENQAMNLEMMFSEDIYAIRRNATNIIFEGRYSIYEHISNEFVLRLHPNGFKKERDIKSLTKLSAGTFPGKAVRHFKGLRFFSKDRLMTFSLVPWNGGKICRKDDGVFYDKVSDDVDLSNVRERIIEIERRRERVKKLGEDPTLSQMIEMDEDKELKEERIEAKGVIDNQQSNKSAKKTDEESRQIRTRRTEQLSIRQESIRERIDNSLNEWSDDNSEEIVVEAETAFDSTVGYSHDIETIRISIVCSNLSPEIMRKLGNVILDIMNEEGLLLADLSFRKKGSQKYYHGNAFGKKWQLSQNNCVVISDKPRK